MTAADVYALTPGDRLYRVFQGTNGRWLVHALEVVDPFAGPGRVRLRHVLPPGGPVAHDIHTGRPAVEPHDRDATVLADLYHPSLEAAVAARVTDLQADIERVKNLLPHTPEDAR